MGTADSIMLYGAEVRAEALGFQKYRVKLVSVQKKGALRIASAFRTVSGSAAQVVAGVIPIDLLAEERKRMHSRKGEDSIRAVRKEEREETLQRWQQAWEN